MELKSIAEVSDLRGKVVLVRASCNVPLVDGKVRNSFRLRRALPTLKYLKEAGAKVIVISHIGREVDETLLPVFEELATAIDMKWGGKVTDPLFTEKKAALNDGDILFCENLRQDVREEENDDSLGALLAEGVDLYVNDAFAEAHREHASTYGVAKLLLAYAGLTLIEEVTELQKVMQPNHPSLFLLGGAKFETKMPLVEKYLALYDHVFVGGALANDVLKARGFEVGTSLVSEVSLNDAPFLWSEKMLVPVDVIVEGPRGVVTKPADQVLPDEKIFDMGPETVELLTRYIAEAKTILWNGPFGNYEAGFEESTEAVAKLIADSDAFSVLGGGDTVAAVEKLGLNEKFGFISIGGGSMLTFMEHGSTPVLDLLKK
ncbi:phosphoglycerate kinase [Candidatus Kaiserbacteria bacterium RIFCSPLOWO2_02_FULL_45_11b]|uniref:Phosphoglycerate kinase n=1 Tax=Candidatus Kaiserbacteria bacterium RIFCSPLOWO2_12_FULL_45_26 TaxID=1798525 RepID=A0A1F6FFN6_9BACT|nr:MAG: phosphoglycerate kinase [Candidatus Kaiserbacteria bacterium RIFCSPHIGHO2_12_45_16]OGG70979.1 MAG: phosphoglycerate kinase [Candidatus Kaiserbacteria bacterium RIFCSPLOWO2_01_FULL_45_25]OGG80919.1 MAG: phosphoglycerate kinase [Candidatus Kaiserbacteria bacterium RIFCSPLOWO2_02_FULL_45_11b]OGG84657.1 MAG: phosphoglycerate kinase [Candidatus Kaiserbacteria bacterium RIFCSPLOWO2_12_FULL_45_26]